MAEERLAAKLLAKNQQNVPEVLLEKTPKPKEDKFDKVITLKVSKETMEMWEQLCENWGEVLGYDNKSKVFEFAMVECLNVPIASLGGYNHEGYDFEQDDV